MDKIIISEIRKLLSAPTNIVIVPHKNPDGDAIGSALGMYHYLLQKKHTVNIVTPNYFPEFLQWMPGTNVIIRHDKYKDKAEKILNEAEIIIGVDFNALSRINSMGELIKNLKAKKILIDHHPEPEDFADYTLSNTKAGATAEIIYTLISEMGDTELINNNVAECLYAGMMTDTNSFSNSAVNPIILTYAAELINKGINHDKIFDLVFNNFSDNRMRLLGHCLNNNLKVFPKRNAAYMFITNEELRRFKFQIGDSEGFVNYPLSIKNIRLSALFVEYDSFVKVSLRSKGDIDVNHMGKIFFNGGGHKNASGGNLNIPLKEALEIFENIIFKFNKL